jgi:RHS repeat-associated protein
VAWSGTDQGSGVATYDVQVKVDDGDWTAWLTATTATEAVYSGELGHQYTFRARATDHVSNTGAWAEASTVVVQVTKYYTFAGQRVAMRSGDQVSYLHGDHLGSTSLVTDDQSGAVGRQWYFPYGETRHASGSLTADYGPGTTDYRFTGQRNEGTIGLYDYRARFYDPVLGRFVQADTVVPEPGNPRDLNRYAYVRNSPLRYTDPSGHWTFEESPGDPYIWERDKPVNTLIRTAEPMVFWEETQDVGELVDQVMWHTVPSSYGEYVKGCVGVDTAIGAYGKLQGAWVINWRSGELTFMWSKGIGGTLSIPNIAYAEASAGRLVGFGYSNNEMLKGLSQNYGVAAQAEIIADVGLEAGLSREVTVEPATGRLVPVYDDVSDMNPFMVNLGVSGGFSLRPTVVDVTLSRGLAETPHVFTIQMYPWNWAFVRRTRGE